MMENKNKILKVGGDLMGRTAEKWQEILWNNLLEKISKMNSKQELRRVLENLISEDERKMIMRRIAAIELIRQGKSYKQISRILWISPATIGAIKKSIFGASGSYISHSKFYQKAKHHQRPGSNTKEGGVDRFLDLIANVAEGLMNAFLAKGIGVTGDER